MARHCAQESETAFSISAGEYEAAIGVNDVTIDQIKFLPNFVQTYFIDEAVVVAPLLVHALPALVAARAGEAKRTRGIETAREIDTFLKKNNLIAIYRTATKRWAVWTGPIARFSISARYKTLSLEVI